LATAFYLIGMGFHSATLLRPDSTLLQLFPELRLGPSEEQVQQTPLSHFAPYYLPHIGAEIAAVDYVLLLPREAAFCSCVAFFLLRVSIFAKQRVAF
jgi:hypothetical protein